MKNLFIFLPAFFAGQIEKILNSPDLFIAFIAFCLAASAIYIFNDYLDVEEDRQHHAYFNSEVFYQQQPDLFWITGNFISDDAVDVATIIEIGRFGTGIFKNIHLEQKFKDSYSPIIINKKDSEEALLVFASNAFLNILNKTYYSYEKVREKYR